MATEELTQGALPRAQWGPVVTGVLCALAAQIVLGLFGAAFGFAAAPAGDAVEILAGLWSILTPVVASFIGAYIAVRVAGEAREAGAYLHGALVWCIGLIAGAVFISGSLASGAMSAGTALSGSVGVQSLQRRDTPANRARAQDAAQDVAKGAGVAAGAGGVAALFGLGGALLGAAAGRGALTGRAGRRSRLLGRVRTSVSDQGVPGESGVAYGERGTVTTRPPADRGVDRGPEHRGAGDDPSGVRH